MLLPMAVNFLASTVSDDQHLYYAPKLNRLPVVAMPQWSQSAYRHGENVAKYGVFPLGEAQKKIENDHIKEDDPINCISQFNRVFHMTHKVTYKFCAQMLQNLDEQPVDDIGVEWNEEKYPMEQVRINPSLLCRGYTCRLLTAKCRLRPSSSSHKTPGCPSSARGGMTELHATRGMA